MFLGHYGAAFALKRRFSSGADGVELIESYPVAFRPKAGTTLRRRLRDEVNYRAQLGYTRYFLPGSFYRRYEMPNPWPWALHPLCQAPLIFAVPGVTSVEDCWATLLDYWIVGELGGESGSRGVNNDLYAAISDASLEAELFFPLELEEP